MYATVYFTSGRSSIISGVKNVDYIKPGTVGTIKIKTAHSTYYFRESAIDYIETWSGDL